ncbi:MAG: phosphoribosylanthranilate isomerase [Candidatus Aureabacteria bacterium]|nr:phosphoribosylanthranilate isomerase [Candidatus Auribacterota bacterium]
MKIKICGLTSYEDLILADQLGADYTGFIYYSSSPRHNFFSSLCRILNKYSGKAVPVLVTVDEKVEKIMQIVRETGIRIVQLHGNESQKTIDILQSSSLQVFKVLSVRNALSFNKIRKWMPDRFLLDAWHPKKKGGVGKPFDWNLLKEEEPLVRKSFIAGGIGTDSIPELLSHVRPWGIDVSSGIEAKPGKKDPKKMEQLFKLYHSME